MCPAFGCGARRWPLAIMLSADQVPVKSTRSKAPWRKWVVPVRGRLAWVRYRSLALSNFVARVAARILRLPAGSRLLCSVAARPSCAQAIRAILLARATAAIFADRRSISSPARVARVPELLGAPDHREGADDEQLSQIAVAGLADASQLLLAAARVLLGHQPDPGTEVAAGAEDLRIGDARDQGSRDQRANAGDASRLRLRLLAAVPSQDTPVHLQDLPLHQLELRGQSHEAYSCLCGNAVLVPLAMSREQHLNAVAADAGNDAELGQMGADRS